MRAYDSNGMVSPSCSGNIAMYLQCTHCLLASTSLQNIARLLNQKQTGLNIYRLGSQRVLTGTTGEREKTVSRSHRLKEVETLGVRLRSFSITCDINNNKILHLTTSLYSLLPQMLPHFLHAKHLTVMINRIIACSEIQRRPT